MIVLSIVQASPSSARVFLGHLRIVSQLFWGEDAGASFTAVIQLGTELAVLVFFAKDIWRIPPPGSPASRTNPSGTSTTAWLDGHRRHHPGRSCRRFTQDLIRENFRNLWITATVLILFSLVFILAERRGKKTRGFEELTMKDAL
ncbi:undecaprenyl-diphosphate phosphatase [Corynebacterium urealyticum]|uniref:undecaprenyl-diphosphate phosphatase n=1 Tax=Corynebacterium urealyticum TaxID=43771 RepID=UPI001F478608|nr:undecaprenyl-diphosphate phosphatase [Corynebacterium urealyticum]